MKFTASPVLLIAMTSIALAPMLAHAQLTDVSQTGPTVPGGAIDKSLEQQIGAGRGDLHTPQSSVYLIKRDPAPAIYSDARGRRTPVPYTPPS